MSLEFYLRFLDYDDELNDLSDFFLYAWFAAKRPGHEYSYTNNWPYDEALGMCRPQVLLWSLVAILGLFIGLGRYCSCTAVSHN